MPQLKFRGIKKENIINISEQLLKDLVDIVGCPEDYFTFEHIHSDFIFKGEEVEGYPFVEMAWFDRGQEVRDKVAKAVTTYIQGEGYKDVDMFFVTLKEDSYYENGEHF
ncbi:DUF1904 domain-containing protein [Oceanirhabdus sp. W0125-5]|uniref:DUF1904 domain-containing protein n=1 Tax=Oceanirhabdus sp. W0125-5 TaxID=2999116 RepID=UPI0022F2CDD2|nr:DUF1904 domain-containing protein [Oceanirhabdus sp. W0125-5]WBW98601.1 DUF1904 domain-containing protein [Oceanirhabdus sp. W0125-5]